MLIEVYKDTWLRNKCYCINLHCILLWTFSIHNSAWTRKVCITVTLTILDCRDCIFCFCISSSYTMPGIYIRCLGNNYTELIISHKHFSWLSVAHYEIITHVVLAFREYMNFTCNDALSFVFLELSFQLLKINFNYRLHKLII